MKPSLLTHQPPTCRRPKSRRRSDEWTLILALKDMILFLMGRTPRGRTYDS